MLAPQVPTESSSSIRRGQGGFTNPCCGRIGFDPVGSDASVTGDAITVDAAAQPALWMGNHPTE